tara:strand:+ start:321 stop:587 length:267 start_codon:yes stop_codon:yes gene_type:complete
MIVKLQNRLVTQTLVTQSIIDLLIEKELFTKDEIEDKIDANIDLFKNLIHENEKLLKLTNEVLEKLPQNETNEEEVLGGLYFGPLGEC